MEESKIKVVVKEPNKPCEIKEIENNYKVLQGLVEGLIDITTLPGREDIDVICNDEYLYNGSPANVMLPERDNIFCGTIVFAGFNEEDGSSISLTDEQIQAVEQYVLENEVENMDVREAYAHMQMVKSLHKNEAEAE